MFAGMVYSDDDQIATPLERGKTSGQKKKCGPMGMKEITRFSSE